MIYHNSHYILDSVIYLYMKQIINQTEEMKMEQTVVGKKYVGLNQLNSIIVEMMEMQDFPKWDFSNNVLECKAVFGENKLWFWFGNLYIVKPGQIKAGDMDILDDWNTLNDGTITLIGRKKREDE